MVRQQATAERLKPVFDYISTHSAEIIAVGKGASLAHLSESRFRQDFLFNRRFKAAFGRTPNQIRSSIKTQELARSNKLLPDKLE